MYVSNSDLDESRKEKQYILSLIVLSIGLQFNSCKLPEQGQLKLNPLFSNHMVLQQKQDVAFWGTYTPNEKITIIGSWGKESTSIILNIGSQ